MKRTTLSLVLLFVTVLCVSAVDKIRVTRPLIAPDTPANRSFVDDILERSAVLASRRYADYFTVEYAGAGGVARGGMAAGGAASGAAAGAAAGRADYTLEIVASLDNEAAGIFEMKKGDEEQSMCFRRMCCSRRFPVWRLRRSIRAPRCPQR